METSQVVVFVKVANETLFTFETSYAIVVKKCQVAEAPLCIFVSLLKILPERGSLKRATN